METLAYRLQIKQCQLQTHFSWPSLSPVLSRNLARKPGAMKSTDHYTSQAHAACWYESRSSVTATQDWLHLSSLLAGDDQVRSLRLTWYFMILQMFLRHYTISESEQHNSTARLVYLAELTQSATCDRKTPISIQNLAHVLTAQYVIDELNKNNTHHDLQSLVVPGVKYGK